METHTERSARDRITNMTNNHVETCVIADTHGHALSVLSPLAYPLGTCVKVEGGNKMWIGEVWGCERESSGEYLVEIEISTVLNDVAETELLASRFRQSKPEGAKESSAPGVSSDTKTPNSLK